MLHTKRMAPSRDNSLAKVDEGGAPDKTKKPRKDYVPTGKPRGRIPGQKNKKKEDIDD